MSGYPLIADHGLIGDLQTAALVATDGSVDWFCAPRFDSPSIFGALLDAERGGHFRVRPTADVFTSKQLYFPDTAVLITRFLTEAGVGEVVDFMPVIAGAVVSTRHRLVRMVRCVRGEMTFVLDIIAMTFGQPRVLFPAIGALVVGGGSITVGTLTAAYAIGALVSSVFSGPLGHVRKQGEAVGWAITVYGAAIAAFGVVVAAAHLLGGRADEAFTVGILPALGLGALCLAVAGGADNVSAVFRGTILQAAAPDGMRGRLQGIFTVVVTGGPRVGDLFAGLVVAVGFAVPPLVGGIAIIGLVALLLRVVPSFRRYDARHPHAN